jgi:hypothetical protein
LRLAFYRQSQTHTTPPTTTPFTTGIPNGAGSTLREHAASFSSIGNSGNMIHRMAMLQLLDFDRERSAQVNLLRLLAHTKNPKLAAEMLDGEFDGLVITMSNIFRPDAKEPNVAELLAHLRMPVYCVGAGLQDALPEGDLSSIDPSIVSLVQHLNDKAALFGVRGERTASWARSVGLKNVVAIGCPSMFAYPSSIMGIESPQRRERVITAGHLHVSRPASERALQLIAGFKDETVGYVFQGETRSYRELLDTPGMYNESVQQIDAVRLNAYLEKKLGVKPPFSAYYSFTEVAAWRQACMGYDLYAGDRIHGGVAAMQAGVPSLVLYKDLRVDELTSHHGIPSCSLDEFALIGCQAAVERYLGPAEIARFKKRYLTALGIFAQALTGAGLSATQAWRAHEANMATADATV